MRAGNKIYTIYILKLRHGKWYVGSTRKTAEARYAEHVTGTTPWTRLHPPVELYLVIPGQELSAEDTWTKKFMKEYGIENVRGASYSNPVLTAIQIAGIENEMVALRDLCFVCEAPGHYASQCPTRVLTCTKCDRTGHLVEDCHAPTHYSGTPFEYAPPVFDGESDDGPEGPERPPSSDVPDGFSDDGSDLSVDPSDSESDGSDWGASNGVKLECAQFEMRTTISLRSRSAAEITG